MDNIVSFEWAVKLKEAGYKNKHPHWFYKNIDDEFQLVYENKEVVSGRYNDISICEFDSTYGDIATLSVGELLQILPSEITDEDDDGIQRRSLNLLKIGDEWSLVYGYDGNLIFSKNYDSLANACASMTIWLKKEGYLECIKSCPTTW